MDLTVDQALKKGVEAHKAGKVQEADRYYTAILQVQQTILMPITIWAFSPSVLGKLLRHCPSSKRH